VVEAGAAAPQPPLVTPDYAKKVNSGPHPGAPAGEGVT
jgi:hypothetical protein